MRGIGGYMKRILPAAAVLMGAAGCGGVSGGLSDTIDTTDLQQDTVPEFDMTLEGLAWADSVMAEMTLEEMAGQLIMPAVFSDDSRMALTQLRKYASDNHVGGVVLLKGTIDAVRAISDTLRRLSPAPPFIAIDAEWGLAMRLEDMPGFPRNGRISEDADELLLFDYGQEVARECRQLGINMVLGPVLDVVPEGFRAGGIGTRSFGSDARRVARLGGAYSRGLESGGVLSVAKHFPGHGAANADSHKRLPTVGKTRAELDSTDLLPFRTYIDNGLSGIMTAHLNVPALEETGIPVTVSEKIQKRLLREEFGFHGLIITDAMNMAGAEGNHVADAIIAGADIVLAPSDTEAEIAYLTGAIRHGRLPMAELRDRVRRVLFYKFLFAGSVFRPNREDAFKAPDEEEINFLRSRLLK